MDVSIWVERWREGIKIGMKREPFFKKLIISIGGLVVFVIPLIISPYFFHKWGDVLNIQNS